MPRPVPAHSTTNKKNHYLLAIYAQACVQGYTGGQHGARAAVATLLPRAGEHRLLHGAWRDTGATLRFNRCAPGD